MPEIDLPDGVWDVAIAAKEAVRYTDHPDNYQAVYGMSSYALRAVIAAAWAAGRESAYTTDTRELVILGWDFHDGPDIPELHRAVHDVSGGKVHIRTVRSGTDDYVVIVSDVALSDDEADAAYRAWEVHEDAG